MGRAGRGARLLVAALTTAACALAQPSATRAEDDPLEAPDAGHPLVFECGAHRWVFDPRGLDADVLGRLARSMEQRGFVLRSPFAGEEIRLVPRGDRFGGGPPLLAEVPAGGVPPSPPSPRDPVVPSTLRGPRPAQRRAEAQEVWLARRGADVEEWIVDGSSPEQRLRLLAVLERRGSVLERRCLWESSDGAVDADVAALVAGGGRLPPDFVPRGMTPSDPLPALPFLGGTVRLDLVEGVPQARFLAVPEGSLAQKLSLRVGDAVLTVNGAAVGPSVLAGLRDEPARRGLQRTLTVRRSHGGIERFVVESWAPDRTER